MAKPRQVRCPNCGGDALWAPENPWRPFCSERCKQIDLGAWASESFCLSAGSAENEKDLRQDHADIDARLSNH